MTVSGFVYGQPLIVADSGDNGMTVYVATMQDWVYAFKIPPSWDGKTCGQITSTSMNLLQGTLAGQHPADACFIGNPPSNGPDNCTARAICPSAGVLGTPVIDAITKTLYLVTESQDKGTDPEGVNCQAKLKNPPFPSFYHYLHALDLAALSEKYGGPAVVGGSVNGGTKTFSSQQEIQRPGLLWYDGNPPTVLAVPRVFLAFSMMDGTRPRPSGWIFSYDAVNLASPPSFYASAPALSAVGAGFWQGAGALAVGLDNNQVESLFVSTADGTFDLNAQAPNNTDAGDSFLKLGVNLAGAPSYFTPSDQYWRNSCTDSMGQPNDLDFGSGGVLLLPDGTIGSHPYVAFKADKEGEIWAIERTTPGGYTGASCGTNCATKCMNANNNLQTVQAGVNAGGTFYPAFFHNNPAYWNRNLYFAGASSSAPPPDIFPLTQFPVCTGTAGDNSCCSQGNPLPAAICPSGTSSHVLFNYGTTPAVSSSGTTGGTGVLWAVDDPNGYTDGRTNPLPEVLHALNAVSMGETYNSSQCAGDVAGPGVKYSVPTVANGFVFLGAQNEVDIYGLIMNKTC